MWDATLVPRTAEARAVMWVVWSDSLSAVDLAVWMDVRRAGTLDDYLVVLRVA